MRNLMWRKYIFLSSIFLFLVGGCTQQKINKEALHKIQIGTTFSELKKEVGIPFDSLQLAKWTYAPETDVLFREDAVFNFRINSALQSDQHKVIKNKKEAELINKWSKLKIGLQKEEVVNLVGEPAIKTPSTLYFYKKHQQIFVENGVVTSIDLHAHASMEKFDRIRLNFNNTGVHIINIALAIIMFGIALELRIGHFQEVIMHPKSFLVGILSQFVVLPFATFLLILIIQPTPSVAMGMILVAACPGGNISNFMSSLSGGNTALSITLTSFATVVTIFMTPFNFSFWGSLYAGASGAIVPISIDAWQMMKTVLLILGIPVALGITLSNTLPQLTKRLQKPIKIFGIVFFVALVIGALSANYNFFIDYIHLIFFLVFGHNLLALFTGFGLANLFNLPRPDRRTLTIETGIQNSGLGLVLIFNPKLFDGLGGMAFIAAWWGIWHIVSGLGLSAFWSRRKISV